MDRKEAVEIVRKNFPDSSFTRLSEALKTLIPELRESEDEKIRKELIDAINGLWDDDALPMPLSVKRKDSWLAWLEKQKQEQPKVSIWKHWKGGLAGNGEGVLTYLIKDGNTYSLSPCLGFECDYIELSELDNLMIEKQDEQKRDRCF